MHPLRIKERVASQTPKRSSLPSQQSTKPAMAKPIRLEQVVAKRHAVPVPKKYTPTVISVKKQAVTEYKQDPRIQHELKEMQETHDLDNIDDDVEDIATLYEWHAVEHNHQPKSAKWYAVLAAATTVITGTLIFTGNLIGSITIAMVGAMTYYVAQKEPKVMRYRILVDGIALNNLLYHYKDLTSFNIVYEPGEVKTVILRGNRTFSPLLHMEIGDADPVAIRDILLEFLTEDQNMEEPLVDILARRLGF